MKSSRCPPAAMQHSCGQTAMRDEILSPPDSPFSRGGEDVPPNDIAAGNLCKARPGWLKTFPTTPASHHRGAVFTCKRFPGYAKNAYPGLMYLHASGVASPKGCKELRGGAFCATPGV